MGYLREMTHITKTQAPPKKYGPLALRCEATQHYLTTVVWPLLVRVMCPPLPSRTRSIAARCASEGLTVVSGGARGVDAAAMQGATEAGGHCIGVLPSVLLKTSLNRRNRIEGCRRGCLVLVSPFYPEAGFGRGANAMARNRYIYTLADQALVIDSALENGGTWAGAVENLKHGWVPLYVRTPGDGAGNAAIAKGALPFTLPERLDG